MLCAPGFACWPDVIRSLRGDHRQSNRPDQRSWWRARLDGGKRISGRKRHLVFDTQGLILHVLVHPAAVRDRRASEAVLVDLRGRYPAVECLFADMGYQGLASWLERALGWTLLIVKRPRR